MLAASLAVDREGERIGLYLLVDFVGHHVDLVEDGFEAALFVFAGVGG